MTERKCEWLDGEEFKRLTSKLHVAPNGSSFLDARDELSDFIRARIEEERKPLAALLESIQFSHDGYCPVCGGWTNPGRGCTPKKHTADCTLAKAIRARGGEK